LKVFESIVLVLTSDWFSLSECPGFSKRTVTKIYSYLWGTLITDGYFVVSCIFCFGGHISPFSIRSHHTLIMSIANIYFNRLYYNYKTVFTASNLTNSKP